MRPTLLATRCGSCGATVYPRVARCPACGLAEACQELTMPTTGTILEATVLHVGLPNVPAPYVVSFVRLDNGIELYCRVAGAEPIGAPAPGTQVELVAEGDDWWAEVVA
ncbi:MAG: OB-fold domain, acyl-CoA-associated [Thermoleophilaceae bacterium]|jgi:uncharacterized OB-fold protein|nr:OB-fold domain, acyl-CoA-associated [Thermoleophilaceae bacterium]